MATMTRSVILMALSVLVAVAAAMVLIRYPIHL